ncbi:Cu2+-exporting ATPase [Mucilaginibacter pineti]|uniref:Cu2+-exporting ATPase n=1 Tax=Mucilaginibacter pineti TaxID=1391627 RepID=A0A1G7NT40_9SPHI|nr:hypothetical protein [Mucilaginibacter pineti]SDF77093.1 Cu2+-exporting ATPase [Mucilaginibacter pineti]
MIKNDTKKPAGKAFTGPMHPEITRHRPRAGQWDEAQLVLSFPVIYVCSSFFARAWLSVMTWNLNMFTLVGLSTGVAFLFSLAGLLLPGMFPPEFKTHHGAVALYFEATTA